jgi:hypothetical protein
VRLDDPVHPVAIGQRDRRQAARRLRPRSALRAERRLRGRRRRICRTAVRTWPGSHSTCPCKYHRLRPRS